MISLSRKILQKTIFIILLCFFVIYTTFPFLYTIVFSFSGSKLATSMFLPESWSIDAFKFIFIQDPIWMYIKNSFLVGGLTCLIVIPASTLAAYSISRSNSRWANFLFFLFIMFRMIPWLTPALPIFTLMNKIHLVDTVLGLALVQSLWLIPLGIWLMRGYFDMIPKELEEAATIDGASHMGALLRVTLPLAVIGIIVTGVFVFHYAYIDYFYALILTRVHAVTIPVKIAGYSVEARMYWREMSAASLMSIIPMIFIFSFLQKYIASGLTFGAIKE